MLLLFIQIYCIYEVKMKKQFEFEIFFIFQLTFFQLLLFEIFRRSAFIKNINKNLNKITNKFKYLKEHIYRIILIIY